MLGPPVAVAAQTGLGQEAARLRQQGAEAGRSRSFNFSPSVVGAAAGRISLLLEPHQLPEPQMSEQQTSAGIMREDVRLACKGARSATLIPAWQGLSLQCPGPIAPPLPALPAPPGSGGPALAWPGLAEVELHRAAHLGEPATAPWQVSVHALAHVQAPLTL